MAGRTLRTMRSTDGCVARAHAAPTEALDGPSCACRGWGCVSVLYYVLTVHLALRVIVCVCISRAVVTRIVSSGGAS